MDEIESAKVNSPKEFLQSQNSWWRKILGLGRLVIFASLIVATVIMAFPDLISFLSLSFSLLLAGVLGIILIMGGTFFFLATPRASLTTAFDFEAIAAIVIGIIAIIILGLVTIFKTQTSTLFIPAMTLMGIYTYYTYRIIRDTLRIKLENEEIRRQYGQLLELDREKSDFMAVTAHQLRTPLTEIRWSLESISQDKNISEPVRTTLQKSMLSVNRIIGIVDEMIRARIFEQNGGFVLKMEKVDAAGLIREIMEELEVFSRQKNTIMSFTAVEQNVTLLADQGTLKMALKNVIDNAIRYSPQGRVGISLYTQTNRANIKIEDSGVGIDPTDYDRIFKKFFRGKNAVLVEPDGTGVGIYTAKKIIEKHNGTIDFTSTLGKGTIFNITMPLAKD